MLPESAACRDAPFAASKNLFTVLAFARRVAGSWHGESISQRDVGKRDVDVARRESERERERERERAELDRARVQVTKGAARPEVTRDLEIFAANYPGNREGNRATSPAAFFTTRAR